MKNWKYNQKGVFRITVKREKEKKLDKPIKMGKKFYWKQVLWKSIGSQKNLSKN